MNRLRASFVGGLALAASALFAQSAHWDPAGGTLPVGQTTALQLVFEDCDPRDNPIPPKVPGLALEYSGRSTNVSFVNGTYSRTVACTFAALLATKQAVEIPPFEVQTNKGAVRVPPARFDAVGATIGGNQSLDKAANSRLETVPQSVWAGEIFRLNYSVQALRGYYPDFGHGQFEWSGDPLVYEDWSQPEPFDDHSGAEPQTGLVYNTRGIARKPGSLTLNPVTQLVNLSVGVTGFGFFQQRQYQQFSVTSNTPSIEVRPLPPAPADFTGAVGAFKLEAKVVPQSAAVGDPVTWTLELSGTGNWPDIPELPPRRVSNDFQVIQPRAKRTAAKGKLFTSQLSEDVVLVPTQAGSYALPPVHFVYFDPKSGTYQTLTAPGATVTVSGAKAAPPSVSQNSGSGAAAGSRAEAATPPSSPTPPSGIPRDPLPESAPASRPLPPEILAALLALPAAAFGLFWLGLAWRRARLTDPAAPLRDAHARLATTIAALRSESSDSPRSRDRHAALLLSWQHDAARLLRIAHAAPQPAAISDPQWSALWSDSESALYGANGGLAPDWPDRAEAALLKKPAPGFKPSRALSPRNLFPFLAVAAICAGTGSILAASSKHLSSPESDYRSGDFPAAEKGWRAAVGTEPANWSARHNLSLALAQQDRWDEAAAQASVALVQNPADPAILWQFGLATAKAGYAPALSALAKPGVPERMITLFSPSLWQRILIGAVGLAAIAGAMLLARGYGLVRVRWAAPTALAGLSVAAVIAIAAAIAWRAYAAAGSQDAVIVWKAGILRSVPTEADTTQKTTPLSAGSIARADRSFLGWQRLSFDNGQTGWVRKDDLVWFWR